jgi:hypothetical protein
VQELARVRRHRRARPPEQQHGADELVARGDRGLGRDAGRHARGPVGHAVGDVAAQLVGGNLARVRRGDQAAAEPRDHDRDGRARGVGGQRRHPGQPVAAEDGVEHLQVDGAQTGHEARRPSGRAAGRGGDGGSGGLVAHRHRLR